METPLKNQLLIIFLSIICNTLNAQKNESVIIKKFLSNEKKTNYSTVNISVFDSKTKQKLPPIIRIDGVSFSLCDTNYINFNLLKGRHTLQIGWVGYLYSKKIHFKTKLSEDYQVTFFLNPDTKPLF